MLLMMSAIVINAQDVANPWHLTAKENGKDTVFYNVEHITDVKATVQTVTVVLDNGKQFSHLIATIFGFSPRRSGTGTANEMITVPQWNVSYANGRLNFSEAVTGEAVYSIMGTLVFKSAGTYTSVPVNLAPGVYVVQAGDKTAKLMVTGEGFGGSSTAVQPVQSVVEPQAAVNAPSSISLRAGTVKIYWNITAASNTTPVEIANVESFKFTPDNSIVFTMKNGNTVELADYQGVTFTTEPVQTGNSDWDWERTLKYGGASYAWTNGAPEIVWAAVSNTGGIAFKVQNDYMKLEANQITNPSMWDRANQPNSRLSVFITNSDPRVVGMSYHGVGTLPGSTEEVPLILLAMAKEETVIRDSQTKWAFNNNTNIISTTILKSGNTIIMKCVDYTGKSQEYIFDK